MLRLEELLSEERIRHDENLSLERIRLEEIIAELRAQAAEREREMAAERKRWDEGTVGHHARLEQRNRDVDALKGMLKESESERSSLRQQHMDEKRKNDECWRQILGLQEAVREAGWAKGSLEARLDQAGSEIESLHAQMQSLSDEVRMNLFNVQQCAQIPLRHPNKDLLSR